MFVISISFLLQAALPRFNEQNLEKNKVLYTRFANLAAKHGCTPPQLALAWVMHQGDDVIPIPGMIPSLLQMFIQVTFSINSTNSSTLEV